MCFCLSQQDTPLGLDGFHSTSYLVWSFSQSRHVEDKVTSCARPFWTLTWSPMSEDGDSKRYLYSALEGRERHRERSSFQRENASPCGTMAQLHCMGGFGEGRRRDGGEMETELGLASEGSDSSHDHSAPLCPAHGNESHGNEFHGNESHGNESVGSSNGNSKDSALLESSGSNKRWGLLWLHHGHLTTTSGETLWWMEVCLVRGDWLGDPFRSESSIVSH